MPRKSDMGSVPARHQTDAMPINNGAYTSTDWQRCHSEHAQRTLKANLAPFLRDAPAGAADIRLERHPQVLQHFLPAATLSDD